MGSGGSSSSDVTETTNIIRYAPYIEDKHKSFLSETEDTRKDLINNSPFDSFHAYDIDEAFFGVGVAITSFSSLFDHYETFMSSVDIEVLYNNVYDKTLNSAETKNLIVAEGKLLNDDIETNGIPRMVTGSRDINSVMSSTFVISKELLEATRLKSLEKFSADLKYRLLPIVADRWKTKLNWNKDNVLVYEGLMKLYFAGRLDYTEQNVKLVVKDKLWPFTILDYERANVGVLAGATSSKGTVAGEGPSDMQKVIGGAMSGASMGLMASGGNPLGGVAGGALGLAASFL